MELVIITACAIGIVLLAIGIFSVWQRQGLILEKQNRLDIYVLGLGDKLKAMNEEQVRLHSNILAELVDMNPLEIISKTDDELYEDARALIVETRKASTSFLQRKLGVGYSRAAMLMDKLEQNGVIGPARNNEPRAVLEQEAAE